jgi:hypothetical protein
MNRVWPFKTRWSRQRGKQQNHPFEPDACPDFFCIGARKGGTTWLYEQLSSHADFWMPPLKELHYFDQMSKSRHPDREERDNLRPRDQRDVQFLEAMDRLCDRTHIDLGSYAQVFAPKGSLLSGDITPNYSVLPDEIIQRIVTHFPNLKVIFLARDPVERAWSELCMGVRCGGIRPFDVTNVEEVTRNLLRPDIILLSYSSMIVARWRRHVHPDRFRVYFFDDLETDPAELRRSIIRFLGGDPEKPSRLSASHKSNETKEKLKLSENVRSHVARFFEPELKACASELGGRAGEWPSRYGFSFLWFFSALLDNLDLFPLCDWVL